MDTAFDGLKAEVAATAQNMTVLTQTITDETAQIMAKLAEMQGQIVDQAAVDELTARLQTVNQAMMDANAAVQGIVP